MSKLIEENSPAHFFLDEVPADELTPDFWSEIQNNFPTENFLWVAYRADTPPHENILKGNFMRWVGCLTILISTILLVLLDNSRMGHFSYMF